MLPLSTSIFFPPFAACAPRIGRQGTGWARCGRLVRPCGHWGGSAPLLLSKRWSHADGLDHGSASLDEWATGFVVALLAPTVMALTDTRTYTRLSRQRNGEDMWRRTREKMRGQGAEKRRREMSGRGTLYSPVQPSPQPQQPATHLSLLVGRPSSHHPHGEQALGDTRSVGC